MSRIVVTGVGGPAGRGLSRLLARLGHHVLGVDAVPPTWCEVPVEPVPAAGAPDFGVRLADLAAKWRADIVVPTVTEELVVPLLAVTCPVAVAPRTAVLAANDKWLTYLRLSDRHVPVPRSMLAGAGGHPGSWSVRRRPGYVSKPRLGRGARGVRVHDDPRSAAEAPAGELIQEFVPGTEYAVQLFVPPRAGGHEHSIVLQKTKLAAGLVGNGTDVVRLAPDACPDVAAVARDAVTALELTGAADVDVRRMPDGRPVVLEVNARVGAHIESVPEIARAIVADYGAA